MVSFLKFPKGSGKVFQTAITPPKKAFPKFVYSNIALCFFKIFFSWYSLEKADIFEKYNLPIFHPSIILLRLPDNSWLLLYDKKY